LKVEDFIGDEKLFSIIYHRDSDGLTSAVLMKKYLESLGRRVFLVKPNDAPGIGVTDRLLRSVEGLLVIVDIGVDQTDVPERFDGKILVIDHHIPSRNLNSERILHINPRLEGDDVYRPASYLIWKMFRERVDSEWVAGVGVYGDYGVGNCKDLMDEIAKKYPDILVEKRYDQVAMRESLLAVLSDMIEASRAIGGLRGLNRAFEEFYRANSPSELLRSRLVLYLDKYRGELERLEQDFRENSEYFPNANAYVYMIESRYNLSSSFSTMISEKIPDSVVLILKKNRVLQVNARCQSGRVNVAELMRELTEGIGSGGGHERAAGAHVPRRHVEEFLNRLREKLETFQG